MKGMSVRRGMWIDASFTPGSPVNPSPIRPDSPSPNRVSDNPVATCEVINVWVRKAKSIDMTTPAYSPARMPSSAEPVV